MNPRCLSSPSHSNPTSGCISRESHPEVHCDTQGRIISKRKRKTEELGSSPTPTPTQGSRKQFLLPQEETELSKSRPWSSSGQVQVQRGAREPGYQTLSPVSTPTLCHMGLWVWHQGGLGSVCTIWFDLLCLCFMGCGRTCPGSHSRTWDLWAKPGTKPTGSATNPPEHRHPQACEPETGAWCWKPWSRGHVSHSVTAAGSGQWADAGKEQGLGSALERRARVVVSEERAVLGDEPYRGLQSYLLDPRSLQIKTTPTEHSEMGNWEGGTRYEAGDCFH